MPQMFVDIDQPKQRLISRVEIAQAILRLTDTGVPLDEWLSTLTRSFYIDLDAFNDIVRLSASSSNRETLGQ